MNVNEAAKALGCARSTAYRLIREGKLEAGTRRICNGKGGRNWEYVVTDESIEAFKANGGKVRRYAQHSEAVPSANVDGKKIAITVTIVMK